MPNHVTNLVTLSGDKETVNHALAFVKTTARLFDFQRIIPMPACLEDYNPHGGIEYAVRNALGLPVSDEPLTAMLEKQNRVRACFTQAKDEEIPQIIRGIQNYQECGHIYWYTWANEIWGTKWNAYDQEQRSDVIKFETAWATPKKVFLALSEIYPALEIQVKYADEDIGSNCGIMHYQSGQVIFEDVCPRRKDLTNDERRKWVKFALGINGSEMSVDEYFAEIEE